MNRKRGELHNRLSEARGKITGPVENVRHPRLKQCRNNSIYGERSTFGKDPSLAYKVEYTGATLVKLEPNVDHITTAAHWVKWR